jgi:hypothetical protein
MAWEQLGLAIKGGGPHRARRACRALEATSQVRTCYSITPGCFGGPLDGPGCGRALIALPYFSFRPADETAARQGVSLVPSGHLFRGPSGQDLHGRVCLLALPELLAQEVCARI